MEENLDPQATQDGNRIIPVNIEEQMKTAYIDYSMSVIVGRALPDVRDGLKPVHRRILYAMNDLNLRSNRPHRKSALVVGEVLGKYHPHGDSSVYDAMVRMAQDWSMRYTMVNGQGNFGTQDGDGPAAMRYTEVKLESIAEHMLDDIEKETVDFQPNYDDSREEPVVLPTRIPQLLVNGSSGIAVGMATNVMPHNLSEVIDGCVAYIENKEITIDELMQYVKAPDFPTGGIIYGMEGIRAGMHTGRGRVVLRGKVRVDTKPSGREQIVISEVPYQVNRDALTSRIGDLVNNKIIDGIAHVNNESNKKEGTRIVIDLKRDAIANVVINQLYKNTDLQTSYGINNVAITQGRPRILNLKDLISEFVAFRHEVVVRRTKFELKEAEKRAHILQGYLIALDHLDEVIRLIRNSPTPEVAKENLINAGWGLDEIQAKAILELRLQRLTGMEREKIKEEFDELMKLITHLKEVLANEGLRYEIITTELLEIKEKYGDGRKTEITYLNDEVSIKDLIKEEDVVITISHLGYIKRTPVDEFRAQRRGGRGVMGGKTREEDFIEHLFVASTHHTLLFFTEKGRCYWLNVYEIPEGEKTGKGRAIQNLMQLPPDDKIRAIIDVKDLKNEEFVSTHNIVLCTQKGIIKKTALEDFSRPRQTGVNAITINEGDRLLEARLTDGKSEIMMAVKSGRAIRFSEEKVRATGRGAIGVGGIEVDDENDEVIGMICLSAESPKSVLVVSEKGYGKRTKIDEYRFTNRGGKGVKTINVTEKTGALVGLLDVDETQDLLITCKSGITIRMRVRDISELGRATQGVKLIRLEEDDQIAAISQVEEQEMAEEAEAENAATANATESEAGTSTGEKDVTSGDDPGTEKNNEGPASEN
ncbi:DNA gyrase subunit A [Niabella drilacis]|uniref:DNA gyrase subunit A n=1 Tax=Niabella drilacis (strain DSM 25811 / CCM 8410 / CCUG 62505 / LMG 26954 / E90) TaxID=1285928 RepID=A0A1G6WYB2_NIADE|nr:DNA gyrase subunit A [Niabella drilacis]SDD69985.1 DNA gyrase subunit A [Niabella drilacis]